MKKKGFILILFYVLLIALPSIIFLKESISDGSDLVYSLSGVFGITSFVLLSFELLLVSRNKLLDKYFGLDKIYRFHMYIAVVALIFAYIHKLLKETIYRDSFQTSLGDDALIIFEAIAVFSIIFMINKLFFKFQPADYLRNFFNKKIKLKYEMKVLIHNIMIIGLIVLIVHILLAFSVKSNSLLMFVLLIYSIVPFALYFNRKIINVYFKKKHKYLVSDIVHEADNILTIKFKPMQGEVFNYDPGQFLYLRINNSEVPGDEHPFTISSSPSQKNYIAITAKQLGDFTKRLDSVKIGDTAQIGGAYGTFSYLSKEKNDKICFIAGGIGITPFLSMIRHMSVVDKNKDVTLLWGARNISEIICKDELIQLGSNLRSFNFIPVLSDDKSYSGEQGFIDQNKIEKYIDSLVDYDFYICGPPIMLEIQIKNLKSLGVPNKNIHFERFAI